MRLPEVREAGAATGVTPAAVAAGAPPAASVPSPPASPRWLVRLWTWGPAAFAALIGLLGTAASRSSADGGSTVWWLFAAVVSTAAIGLRFRWPWTTLLASAVVVLSGPLQDESAVFLLLIGVPLLPLVAVAATARPLHSGLAAVAITGLLVLAELLIGDVFATSTAQSVVLGVAMPAVSVVAAWLIGYALLVRRQYADALIERARRLEHERDVEADRAVAEERTRIARDLHDLVSHNVAVMVVQAGAADAIWDADPARAREALRAVEETGRSAMGELRVMLQAMRGRDDEVAGAERQAQPGLVRLPAVLEQVRTAGIAVGLAVEGELDAVPPVVDLSLLRVVQEAITNVLRHARASAVEVSVVVDEDAVLLQVGDDGVGLEGSRDVGDPLDPTRRGGHGLVGMRERVAALGGTLTVDPGSAGGTIVAVRVPLNRHDGR